MKDEEFLQRAASDRVALIAEMEKSRKSGLVGAWFSLALLAFQIVMAVVRDTRFIDFGPLLTGLAASVLFALHLYHDALIKALKVNLKS